jgi:hypothetical protein
MIEIMSAFGLSAATGLNAYLPLLIVGLMARFTTLVTLSAPWNTLENTWVLATLAILLIIETAVDKIPGADTLNDLIQTFIRPVAGAILFTAGSTFISDISPVLAMICGLIISGGVHTVKTLVRPLITAGTGGIGNPLVSLGENIIAAVSTFLAIIFPVGAIIVIVAIFVTLLIFFFFVRRSLRRDRVQPKRIDPTHL